jgi:hypothetical protein
LEQQLPPLLLLASDSFCTAGRRGKPNFLFGVSRFGRSLRLFPGSHKVGHIVDLDSNEYEDHQVTPLQPNMSQRSSSFGQHSQVPIVSPARELLA